MSNLPAVKTQDLEAVVPVTPKEVMTAAAEQAKLLKSVVDQAGLAKKLGGKKEHLEYEAWALIAKWNRCSPHTEWTRPIREGDKIIGWEARVQVLNETGEVIGAAENMCMADEPNWRNKPQFSLRSMAQTRTASKALRMQFSHVAVLAGYSPTPVEEMDGVVLHSEPKPAPKAKPAAKPKSIKEVEAIVKAEASKHLENEQQVINFLAWYLAQAEQDAYTVELYRDLYNNMANMIGLYKEEQAADVPL